MIRRLWSRTLSSAGSRLRSWWLRRYPTVQVAGITLRLAPHITPEIRPFLMNGQYESDELAVISATLDATDTVMELGTGIGLIATFCSQRIGSDRVHTFEANPAMEACIRDTFRMNEVKPSLTMCLMAGDSGERLLHVARDFWVSSVLPGGSHTRPMIVSAESVADHMRRVAPTYLVVDIEGGEVEIFDHVDLARIRKLCVEIHEDRIGTEGAKRVKRTLEAAGLSYEQSRSRDPVWFFCR